MVWSDVSSEIAVDKVIRASTHQKIFDNFLAMANGDPGAPKVQAPTAMATTELGTGKVLHPDGLGGLFWGNTNNVSYSNGIGASGSTRYVQTGPHDQGTYLIIANGRHRARDSNLSFDQSIRLWSGFCVRVGNTIVLQSAIYTEFFSPDDDSDQQTLNYHGSAFSVAGANTRFNMYMPSSAYTYGVQANAAFVGLQIG